MSWMYIFFGMVDMTALALAPADRPALADSHLHVQQYGERQELTSSYPGSRCLVKLCQASPWCLKMRNPHGGLVEFVL